MGLDAVSQTVFTPGGPTDGETSVFLYDGHGSVRMLANMLATVAESYDFDAYGNALGFNPASALTSLLYSGEHYNPAIAQQYLRARWYDAGTGRFNRIDPFTGNFSDPQSLHKYLYTHADPINGIDPSGMFTLGGLAMGALRFLLPTGFFGGSVAWMFFWRVQMGIAIALITELYLNVYLPPLLRELKALKRTSNC